MRKLLASISVFLLPAFAAVAQTNRNSYFLDNNLYSYRINPAIRSEKPFVGLIINNISTEDKSNLGISSFLYPRNGELVTGLNSAVSTDEFLGNLKDMNALSVNLDETILAFGFDSGENAFSNVEVNLRTNISGGIPKSLFEFLKKGSSGSAYRIGETKVNANSYLEIAYGYSQKINERIRVGGRLKVLLGAANLDANITRADVTVNGEKLEVDAQADLKVAAPEVSFRNNEEGYMDISNPVVSNKFGLAGLGAALDLGMTFEPVDGLTLSASVNDLGGISWKNNVTAQSAANASFEGTEFTFGQENSAITDDLEAALKKLEDLLKFKQQGGETRSFEMLPCTINFGARYRMPFYDRLSAGVLAAYRTNRYVGWFDIRGGLTITPIDWFSLCGTVGYNSYCPTCGAALSFNLANLNFFLSAETFIGDLARIKDIPVPVPVNAFREQLNFGINITFGQRGTAFKAAPHRKTKNTNGQKQERDNT